MLGVVHQLGPAALIAATAFLTACAGPVAVRSNYTENAVGLPSSIGRNSVYYVDNFRSSLERAQVMAVFHAAQHGLSIDATHFSVSIVRMGRECAPRAGKTVSVPVIELVATYYTGVQDGRDLYSVQAILQDLPEDAFHGDLPEAVITANTLACGQSD